MGFSAAPSAPSSRKVYLWVLYCRVYSATALKHSLVGFLPRAPCGPADSIELVGQADVLCAVSLHHSIYGIVSHAPAMIPPPFAGLPDASSPLPRLCWPGLVPMYSRNARRTLKMSVAARCLWLSRVRRAAIVRLQCAVVDRVGPGVNPQLMHLPIAGMGVAAHAVSWRH